MADILNKLNTANYITVKVTDNPIANGNNLLAAYNLAKSTNPNGLAKSATNRVNIILPVAIYDLGTQSLTLDAQFIDIIGSTDNRDEHYIRSDVVALNRGVITQTANDVRLLNLTIENTNNSYSPGSGNGSATPATYFPNSNLPLTYIENVRFLANDVTIFSTRSHNITYSGTYINCAGGRFAFGGGIEITGLSGLQMGTLSGTFINCTGGDGSFGGTGPPGNIGNAGFLTGTFRDCTGGNFSFGGSANAPGALTGTFINCIGGAFSFGGLSNASMETNLTGTFINCRGGPSSFGAAKDYDRGFNGGTFINCIGGTKSFDLV